MPDHSVHTGKHRVTYNAPTLPTSTSAPTFMELAVSQREVAHRLSDLVSAELGKRLASRGTMPGK